MATPHLSRRPQIRPAISVGLPVALSRAVLLHQDWWKWATYLSEKQGTSYKDRHGNFVRGRLEKISVFEHVWQQCWGQGSAA